MGAMADLSSLLWLRWRRWSRAGLYWLAVLGYDPGAGSLMDRAYGLYVLIAIGVIAVLGWAGAVHAARQVGLRLAAVPRGTAPLVALLSPAVLVGVVIAVGVALASSPLKLSAADTAHVAGAPLSRGAVVAVAFARRVPVLLLAAAAGGDLASLVLSGSPHFQGAGAVTAAAVTLLGVALAWALGLLRLSGAAARRRSLWPLSPLAAGLLWWLWPAAALWPGRALVAALIGQGPVWNLGLLLAVAAALVGLAAAGARANMTLVAEESGLFAGLAALGAPAVRDPGAARQVRVASTQAGRRPVLGLPPWRGVALLLARAVLSYLRRPSQLLWLFRDLSLTVLGCWLLVGQGAGLPWFDWVFAAAAIPPRGLGDVFDQDVREPFLRQLLPLDDLALLVADAAPAALVVWLLSVAAWVVRRPVGTSLLSGVLCAGILVALRGLCQAVAPGRRQAGVWRPPFIAVSGGCLLLLAVIAVPAHAPGLALGLGAALVVALAGVARQL